MLGQLSNLRRGRVLAMIIAVALLLQSFGIFGAASVASAVAVMDT